MNNIHHVGHEPGDPFIIGKTTGIQVTYITPTKVYGKLRWLKDAVGRLRF